MREIRKPIPGFDGYFASNLGYVYINGSHWTIAKLVALTFIPNDIGDFAVVFHLDEDPTNNAATNLAWVTPGELRKITSKGNVAEVNKIYLKEIRNNDRRV